MANTLVNVQLQVQDEPATVAARVAKIAGHKHAGVAALSRELQAVMGGARPGKVTLGVESTTNVTKASASIGPIVHASVSEGDTITIGGRVLTVDNTPDGNDFAAGADEIECAANLAAAINANAELAGIVTAVSDGVDTVTLTYYRAGREGNLITLASSDGTAFPVSGARFTGATTAEQSAPRDWSFGV